MIAPKSHEVPAGRDCAARDLHESKNNIASRTPGVRVQTVNANLVVQKWNGFRLRVGENASPALSWLAQ
jgi:hypothetical protein